MAPVPTATLPSRSISCRSERSCSVSACFSRSSSCPTPREVPRSMNAPRILVVEDDDGQARLTERALRPEGREVARAATGAECLAVLRAAVDWIVLLDLGLPDMPGVDVLERVVAQS